MRSDQEKQIFRDAQGARISRWIRDSEAGWLFYGPGGTPFHILSDEAARLEAEGNAIVERLLGPGFVALPGQGTIIAALTGVPLLLGWFLPADFSVIAIPAALLVMIVPMLALNMANDAAYEIALRRWRRRVAARLAEHRRSGVPMAVAQKHRRYNLFLMICIAATLGMLGTTGLMVAGVLGENFFLLQIAFVVLALAVSPAARRVDDTHRRRKWLD
jgi:hypothetical protein